jgi:hypothetical protein
MMCGEIGRLLQKPVGKIKKNKKAKTFRQRRTSIVPLLKSCIPDSNIRGRVGKF